MTTYYARFKDSPPDATVTVAGARCAAYRFGHRVSSFERGVYYSQVYHVHTPDGVVLVPEAAFTRLQALDMAHIIRRADVGDSSPA